MMNIFIMILAVLVMGAYYMLSSPSQRTPNQETDTAIMQSDLRTIADCTMAAHNATMHDSVFDDVCVEQFQITSQTICLTSNLAVTKCETQKNKKPAYSYIITASGILADTEYNNMMEVLETHYPDAGTFGIFMDNQIISGGTLGKRVVPKAIADKLELTDGQLVYMTQYEIPDAETEFAEPYTTPVNCPAGTVKSYRFGRWQCIGYNTKTNCGGDMIWDEDLLECVPDESRKPLCASQQTAVMVDTVWECINPFPDKQCPDNMTAHLNYTTMEWECVTDPNMTQNTKKCANVNAPAIYGKPGATLRVPATSCTDCEVMLTDMDTCKSVCVPDPSKLNDPACYSAPVRSCSGPSRAFYFGFPSITYAANVSDVRGKSIPMDRDHSQNRRFNCLDCKTGVIDESKSFPPYIAVCK